jgi:DNA-binding NarL/FixJ family response regulator
LELTATLAEQYPDVKVIALGLIESEARVLQFVEAGGDGYVAKDDSVDVLLKRIRAAYRDRAVVSPEIAAALMSQVARYAQLFSEVEAGLHEGVNLTPREYEILELIAEGLSNREIADLLVIQVGTVKNHVHSILQKLDVSSREDAAAFLSFVE